MATDPLDAIAADDVDAVVLATPGPTHEKQLLACLEHGKPVLCEKPLTTDVETSLEVVRREAELDKPLIQVGFMRRFDPEYQQLKALIDGGELGRPLVMHCAHRNPAVPPSFDSAMIVKDSLVHEVDVTRFLFGEEIASVQIIKPAANPGCARRACGPADRDLRDRQSDVTSTSRCSSPPASPTRCAPRWWANSAARQSVSTSGWSASPAPDRWGGQITPGFRERFGQAYDIEVQRWVDAVRSGVNVDGPDGMGRLRRRGGMRRRRRVARVRRARRGRARRPDRCLT